MLNTYLWVLTVIYLGLLLYIGYRARKVSINNYKDYAIASKSFPGYMLFFTFFATMWGMTNFVGHGDKTAQLGLSWLPFIWGEQSGKIIFALVLGNFIAKYSYNTLSEFIDDLIVQDKHTKAIVGLLLSTLGVAWTGAQCLAVGQLFSTLTGADTYLVTIITGIVVIAYTAMGGIVSVVWTDLVQGILMVGMGLGYYLFVFSKVNFSFNEIAVRVQAMDPKLWSFEGVSFIGMISLFLTSCMAQFTYQTAWQRFFSAKRPESARNAYLAVGIISVIGISLTALTGLIAKTAGASGQTGLTIWMIKEQAPMWMALVIFLLVGGATLSTADSFLNSGAINIVNDVIKTYKSNLTDQQLVRITTWVTVIMGTLSMLGSLKFKYIVDYAAIGYTISGATVFPLLVIGLLWRKDKTKGFVWSNCNVSAYASRVGLVCGGIVSILFQMVPSLKAIMGGGIIPGAIVTTLLIISISIVNSKTQKEEITTR